MEAYDRYKSKIMYYLKNFNTIKACEEMRREEILEASNYELEASGVHGTKLSDTTAQRALKLADYNEDKLWIELIEKVLKTYHNELASKCVQEKYNINYFKTKGGEGRYLDMYSRARYYVYQRDIIEMIAYEYVKIKGVA